MKSSLTRFTVPMLVLGAKVAMCMPWAMGINTQTLQRQKTKVNMNCCRSSIRCTGALQRSLPFT